MRLVEDEVIILGIGNAKGGKSSMYIRNLMPVERSIQGYTGNIETAA